jgi:hypothetical protein
VDIRFATETSRSSVGVVVWDVARNLYVYGASSDAIGLPPIGAKEGDAVSLEFRFTANLTRGLYAVEVNVFDPDRQTHLAVVNPAHQFVVWEKSSYGGIANLYLMCSMAETDDARRHASHVA